MRALSFETFKTLVQEDRMKVCCLADATCHGVINWHHNCIVGGSQSDLPGTILGICEKHHDQARNSLVKEKLDYIMFKQMSDEEFKEINHKGTFSQRKIYLFAKYDKSQISTSRKS